MIRGEFRAETRGASAECGALAPGRSGVPSRLLLVLLFVLGLALSGCASLGGPGSSGAGRSPSKSALVRPDMSASYDVLVGEMARQDGDFAAARAAYERAIEKDPDSAYLHLRLARYCGQLQDVPAAREHAERALELDPDDVDTRIFLGRIYQIQRDFVALERVLRGPDGEPIDNAAALDLFRHYLASKRLDEALEVVKAVVAKEPGNLPAQLGLATVLERLGRDTDAEAALRAALEHHPDRFVLYTRLARIARARGDRSGEVAVYQEALDSHPGHYGMLKTLGETLIDDNDLEGAIGIYEELVRRYPTDIAALRRLASLEFAAGKHEAAERRLAEALAANPDHHELAYSLGQVRRGMGNDTAALEAFEQVPADDANYVDARLQVSSILEEEGEMERALAELEAVRDLRPARALDFHIASLRARTGDVEGGVALLEAMLEDGNPDEEVLYQLGVLYGSVQQVDKALDYMQRVLVINPDNAHALNYVGYTYAERGEKLDEAEELIRRALSVSPEDGYITDSLGWVYYQKAVPLFEAGSLDAAKALIELAREQLLQADELTGGDPVVSEHLGDVYLLEGNKAEALRYYEEAVTLGYRPDEQPDLLRKLELLRTELEATGSRGE